MAKLFKGVAGQLETLFDLARLFLEAYRTSEKDTGQDWLTAGLDYRIYRKVIAVAAGPNAGAVNAPHGVSALDDILDIKGVLRSGTTEHPLNWYDGTNHLSANRVGDNIVLNSNLNLSTYAGHIVIEYTKS